MSGDKQLVCALPGCTVTFVPRRSTQRFCSPLHGQKASNTRRYKGRTLTPGADLLPTDIPIGDAIRTAELAGYLVHRPEPAHAPIVFDTSSIRGERVRVAFISDTHIGSKYQQVTLLGEFMRYAEKEAKVDCFIHGGDVTDGPVEAHRGAIHEMWTGTYDGQRAAAIEMIPQTKKPMYVIRGNHDEFYLKNAGGDIVGDICKERGFDYVGRSSSGALIEFGDVRVLVQHPHDGVGYALSYKLQRRIEALAPENKPHILALGNYHKVCHLPAWRNVEGFLLPAFQSQSAWMASKGLASIVGGLIIGSGPVARERFPVEDELRGSSMKPYYSDEWVTQTQCWGEWQVHLRGRVCLDRGSQSLVDDAELR